MLFVLFLYRKKSSIIVVLGITQNSAHATNKHFLQTRTFHQKSGYILHSNHTNKCQRTYQVPEWFRDGKIGVWAHWGIPSSIDENRPNDGSHYGRRMYGPSSSEQGGQREMTEKLAAFHSKRYGPPAEFGYEKLVPLFKGEKWDPETLVKFFKQNGGKTQQRSMV